MRYALLFYLDPADRGGTIAEGAYPDWVEYTRALKKNGALVGGEHLHEADTATSVRVRGDRLLTDGPFAETKEHLLGFFLIEVPDLDAALDWAAKAPLIGFGTVEVRGAHTGAAWQAVLNE